MLARVCVILAVVLLGPGFLPAYVPMYMPLGKEELQRRVPQKKIADVDPTLQGKEIRVGSTRIRIGESSHLAISGVDRAGNPWKVATHVMQGGTVWQADLDNNGSPDLVIALFTGGNGWAPSQHLLFLMFDSQGRPIPWEVDGYFRTDARGIEDLLDLNQDRHVQLLRQSFDDGYWVTSLYQSQEARWQIVHGDLAGRSYPLYTRFTNRANHAAVTPMNGRFPREDDLSNTVLGLAQVSLTAVQWSEGGELGEPTVKLSDGRTCGPISWYSTLAVVIDRTNRRDIAMLGDSESTRKMLAEIRRHNLPVVVGGHRRNSDPQKKPLTECLPEFIWAEDRQSPGTR